jgi:hypothetical protein
MGTRGAIGFRVNNEEKIQYNHFDSYPSYLGLEILNYIQGNNIQALKETAEQIILVDEDDKPTEEQIMECQPWTNLDVSSHSVADWYCLLRDAQGGLNAFSEGLQYMIDYRDFLKNSLFCEYAYIINIDEQVLEYYCGFNKKPRIRKGRYATIESQSNDGYYGVVLLKKYPLENLFNATNEDIQNIVAEMEKKEKMFSKKQDKEIKEGQVIALAY